MSSSSEGLDEWIVADGRLRVRLNGSGSISLDFGDGEIDLDDIVADDLSTALAQAASRLRST